MTVSRGLPEAVLVLLWAVFGTLNVCAATAPAVPAQFGAAERVSKSVVLRAAQEYYDALLQGTYELSYHREFFHTQASRPGLEIYSRCMASHPYRKLISVRMLSVDSIDMHRAIMAVELLERRRSRIGRVTWSYIGKPKRWTAPISPMATAAMPGHGIVQEDGSIVQPQLPPPVSRPPAGDAKTGARVGVTRVPKFIPYADKSKPGVLCLANLKNTGNADAVELCVKVRLFDTMGKIIQEVDVTPRQSTLPPGKRTSFQVRLEHNTPMQTTFEITWAE